MDVHSWKYIAHLRTFVLIGEIFIRHFCSGLSAYKHNEFITNILSSVIILTYLTLVYTAFLDSYVGHTRRWWDTLSKVGDCRTIDLDISLCIQKSKNINYAKIITARTAFSKIHTQYDSNAHNT